MTTINGIAIQPIRIPGRPEYFKGIVSDLTKNFQRFPDLLTNLNRTSENLAYIERRFAILREVDHSTIRQPDVAKYARHNRPYKREKAKCCAIIRRWLAKRLAPPTYSPSTDCGPEEWYGNWR